MENQHLYCQYLVSYLDHKSNTGWAVVGRLTTICNQCPAVTKLLLTCDLDGVITKIGDLKALRIDAMDYAAKVRS